MSNLYMHTINGRPARFIPGHQIIHFNHLNKIKFDDVFVRSLKEIKRQQMLSTAWRVREGMTHDLSSMYGYIRISDNRACKANG